MIECKICNKSISNRTIYGLCKSCRWKQWRLNNLDYLRSKNKINKIKIRKRAIQLYWKNREHILLISRARNKKRYKSQYEYKIRVLLRNRFKAALRAKNIIKKQSIINLTGCTTEELKNHLEKQFKDGMSWDNYNYYGWHIDHIIPCEKFDLTNEEEQKKCFHYTNLQPLWRLENQSKR